ncbi:MAG: hypothetical protein PUC00_10105 [Clostridiales bacterium]|nr:hypothetical protein [Clostridiales bacterium]
MNKKFSAGAWFAIAAAVLAVVSFVIYSVNIGGAGYFQNAAVSTMPLTWAAIAALVVTAALSMVETKGYAGNLVALVTGALQIAAPVVLAYCLISLIGGRIEGLGFIYFSNADVAKEVQTAANLSSATWAIASMVAYGVSLLASVISAFVDVKKA